jgi:hypothetical protein
VRGAAAFAVGLFFVVLISRSPFAAQTLWAHDSVLYAQALERGFHVDDELREQRPHPPGYLFYVASAGAARAAGLGSNDALVLVSAIASALTAAALFLLARRWVPDGVALVAAAAYAADPLVWQYSEIAYPYTVLGLGSITVAWCCLAARGRGARAAILASVAFAICGGFRQDLLVLLAPLWLWMAWPLGARRAAIAGAAGIVACAAWLVPTMLLSGGPGEYLGALASQASYVRDAYSIASQGVPALVANLSATSYALGWGLLAMTPLAVASAVFTARASWRIRAVDDAFALVWCVPPLALYVTLHIGDWGYVLSALPALYLLGARALAHIVSSRPRRLALPAAWAGAVVAPALLFVWSPAPFSAGAIASHDREMTARFAYVREQFEPRSTMILTREDFLLVRYYLPEFRARQYDPEPFARAWRRMRAGRVERIVVLTQGLVPEQPLDVRRVQCSTGIDLVYLDVAPDAVLEFRGERYAVASPAP